MTNEDEHMESCGCCQSFLAMEKRYDHLRGHPQDEETFVHSGSSTDVTSSGWYAMESAPRDGRTILGWIQDEPQKMRWAEQRQCMLAGIGGGNGYFGPGWEDTENNLVIQDDPILWAYAPTTNQIEGDKS